MLQCRRCSAALSVQCQHVFQRQTPAQTPCCAVSRCTSCAGTAPRLHTQVQARDSTQGKMTTLKRERGGTKYAALTELPGRQQQCLCAGHRAQANSNRGSHIARGDNADSLAPSPGHQDPQQSKAKQSKEQKTKNTRQTHKTWGPRFKAHASHALESSKPSAPGLPWRLPPSWWRG